MQKFPLDNPALRHSCPLMPLQLVQLRERSSFCHLHAGVRKPSFYILASWSICIFGLPSRPEAGYFGPMRKKFQYVGCRHRPQPLSLPPRKCLLSPHRLKASTVSLRVPWSWSPRFIYVYLKTLFTYLTDKRERDRGNTSKGSRRGRSRPPV